jgi:inorganic pyrophosphatase/exopolyphosphatase
MTGNPATLVTRDLKEFTNTGLCFGLGQIETVDLNQLTPERQEELRRHLEEETKRAGWRFAVLMITDVLKSESLLLAVSGSGPAGWWSDWTPHRKAGLVSRKKQLVPLVLEEIRKGATS